MGMTEDFEASLQVLRGFDTDITQEVNEIKVFLLDFLLVHFEKSGILVSNSRYISLWKLSLYTDLYTHIFNLLQGVFSKSVVFSSDRD